MEYAIGEVFGDAAVDFKEAYDEEAEEDEDEEEEEEEKEEKKKKKKNAKFKNAGNAVMAANAFQASVNHDKDDNDTD
eukprot:14677971-Ditylum_brightwellii.AAC.1